MTFREGENGMLVSLVESIFGGLDKVEGGWLGGLMKIRRDVEGVASRGLWLSRPFALEPFV